MSSESKRKHKTLTLNVKAEILKKLDEGVKVCVIAKYYNIGRSTVHDIRQNRQKIENFVKSAESSSAKRKTLKGGKYSEVDEAVHKWFLKERGRHAPISGDILRDKAKFFYRKISSNDDFKASAGWLDKFKRRYGIRLLNEKNPPPPPPSDTSAVIINPFIKKFEELVNELELIPDQVYSVDESGLFWKLPPHKSFEVCKDRIVFMLCANASGTHKLDPLVVGKSTSPRAFKNVSLPVVYKNQSKPSVTRELFDEWFYEDFEPAVRKFMTKRNLPQKALLVLDKDKASEYSSHLMSKDGKIRTLFLPLDQRVVQMVKSRYKKKLLMQAISQHIINTYIGINLKDAVFMLAEAWKSTSSNLIKTSWKNLWPSTAGNTLEVEDGIPLADVLKMLAESNLDVDKEEINDWLQGRDENVFMNELDIDVILKIEDEDMENDSSLEELDGVLASFNTCVKWAERNGVSVEDVMVLRKLREDVFKKSFIVKNTNK